MNLYLELYCYRDITLKPGDFICIDCQDDRQFTSAWSGKDEYQIRARLAAGRRIAGFGRSRIYSTTPLFEAEESQPVTVTDFSYLAFHLSTNICLTPSSLTRLFFLRIIFGKHQTVDIALDGTDAIIDWPSRGHFLITLPRT